MAGPISCVAVCVWLNSNNIQTCWTLIGFKNNYACGGSVSVSTPGRKVRAHQPSIYFNAVPKHKCNLVPWGSFSLCDSPNNALFSKTWSKPNHNACMLADQLALQQDMQSGTARVTLSCGKTCLVGGELENFVSNIRTRKINTQYFWCDYNSQTVPSYKKC